MCSRAVQAAVAGYTLAATLLSGCVWSVRNELVVTNPDSYLDILSSLAVNSIFLHSGSSIDPSITIDYLTLDDDNDNILDGTPHYDEIAAGFAAHNMDAPELALINFVLPDGVPELISPSWRCHDSGARDRCGRNRGAGHRSPASQHRGRRPIHGDSRCRNR